MWSTDPALITALSGNHSVTTQVQVVSSSGVVTSVQAGVGSTSDATLTAQVARTAALNVDYSYIAAGLFDPVGDRVFIRQQVPGFPDIPIFTGRPSDFADNPDGSVKVNCVDFGDDIVNDDFINPTQVGPPTFIGTAMRNIIQDVNPAFGVMVDSRIARLIAPVVVLDGDRGQALDKLGSAAVAYWISDRAGGFMIFANPFALSPLPSPTIILRDGVGGVLVDVQHAKSRNGLYNSITLVVERGDVLPFIVTAQDLSPSSPTRYGGPMGKRNRTIKTQSVNTYGGGLTLAQQILSQSLALSRTWRIQVPHMPIFDPGDVIGLWYRNEVTAQVVQTVRNPLDESGPTELTTRELVAIVGTDAALG